MQTRPIEEFRPSNPASYVHVIIVPPSEDAQIHAFNDATALKQFLIGKSEEYKLLDVNPQIFIVDGFRLEFSNDRAQALIDEEAGVTYLISDAKTPTKHTSGIGRMFDYAPDIDSQTIPTTVTTEDSSSSTDLYDDD